MSDSLPRPAGRSPVPVSAKAVLLHDGAVLLGVNDRDEWELLGGRPEAGESLQAAVGREVWEEAGVLISIGRTLLDEPFEVLPGRVVRVVAFQCDLAGPATIRPSSEHLVVRWVPLPQLDQLRLPAVYRLAIDAAR